MHKHVRVDKHVYLDMKKLADVDVEVDIDIGIDRHCRYRYRYRHRYNGIPQRKKIKPTFRSGCCAMYEQQYDI